MDFIILRFRPDFQPFLYTQVHLPDESNLIDFSKPKPISIAFKLPLFIVNRKMENYNEPKAILQRKSENFIIFVLLLYWVMDCGSTEND